MKPTLLFASLILLSSCTMLKNASITRDIYKAALVNSPVNDTIHFQPEFELMKVYVQVNNHPRPLEFIFDTGANLTVINSKTAEELGLESDRHMSLGDSKGTRNDVPVVMIDTLQLGQGIYTNVLAAVIPFPENSLISCIASDGILGYHVIRELQWSVHPGDTILIGSSQDLRGNRTYDAIPMKGQKAPMLTISFDGTSYSHILFDTGSTGGLDLGKSQLPNHAESKRFIAQIDGTSQGVYGNVVDTIERVYNDTVIIGTTRVASGIDFNSTDSRKIGMGSMGDHHFIIDGRNELLYLSTTEREQSLSKTFGIIPGMNDSTLYISSVDLEGTAIELGLNIGTPINSVNGIRFEDIRNTPCGYKELIMKLIKSGDYLEIELQNGEILSLHKTIPEGRFLRDL